MELNDKNSLQYYIEAHPEKVVIDYEGELYDGAIFDDNPSLSEMLQDKNLFVLCESREQAKLFSKQAIETINCLTVVSGPLLVILAKEADITIYSRLSETN